MRAVKATTLLWAQIVNDPTSPNVRTLCELITKLVKEDSVDVEDYVERRIVLRHLRSLVQHIERSG